MIDDIQPRQITMEDELTAVLTGRLDSDHRQQLLRRALASMLSLSFTRARVKEAARRPEQLPGYLRMFFGTGGHTEQDCLVDYSPAGIRIVPDSGEEIETYTWTRVANEILRMIARGEL